jgi:hypothetical protein
LVKYPVFQVCRQKYLRIYCTPPPPSHFQKGLHTKVLYTLHVSPIPATCSAHYIHLDYISLIISLQNFLIPFPLNVGFLSDTLLIPHDYFKLSCMHLIPLACMLYAWPMLSTLMALNNQPENIQKFMFTTKTDAIFRIWCRVACWNYSYISDKRADKDHLKRRYT